MHSHWNIRLKDCTSIKRIGDAWYDLDDYELNGEAFTARHDAFLATMSAMIKMMRTFQVEFEKDTSRILGLASLGDYQTGVLNTRALESAVRMFGIAIDYQNPLQIPYTGQRSHRT